MVEPEDPSRCPAERAPVHFQTVGGPACRAPDMSWEMRHAAVEHGLLVVAALRRTGTAALGHATDSVHMLLDRHEFHRSDVPSVALKHRDGSRVACGTPALYDSLSSFRRCGVP